MQEKEKITTANPLILIVDDIPKNLQVLSSILNLEGYQIAFAANGKESITVLETTTPDLILLDIMMPGMDGFEVCKFIKADIRLKNIPIIFITGKAEQEDIVKGLNLGAVDYITKPFNATELISRVKTHIELKKSRDKIIEYTRELEKNREELKQLNASKDKFFSIIAHDLRSPFTGFLGLSQLLIEEKNNIEKIDLEQIALSMNKAAKKLFNFLENLLDWSRSQMGGLQFNPINVEIKNAVDSVFFVLKETAAEKGVELINNIYNKLTVIVDNNALNTILRNLVSNSIKFTKKSGKIIIGIHSVTDDFITVFVKDNGIGIAYDNLDNLFRLETKVSTPGTNNEQGSGLGLLLVKEFVEKNGGNIWIESELNIGTTVFFTLSK
jgi:two-component system, sensor histidine kinase and response regulator